jgi:hypothetical protein
MQSKITRRILSETGIPRLLSVLAEDISPGDLQSLLLSVYRARVQDIRDSDVLARSRRTAMAAPSSVDARLLNEFDRLAFAAADAFEAIELSPVSPLGTNFVLGQIDQNNLLTTIRNAEVLGDCTPALALECARRRKRLVDRSAGPPLRLCSSHRVVRMQPFDTPGFTPHFRLFGMVSAGRDTGSLTFELQHLSEHIRFYLQLLRALNGSGFSLTNPLVQISDVSITGILLESANVSRDRVREQVRAHAPGSSERFLAEHGITLPSNISDPAVELKAVAEKHGLEELFSRLCLLKQKVVEPLRTEYPEAEFRFNLARLEGLGYYTGLCLRISPASPDGVRYPIVDGGFTNWTARLLQDNKERLLTTGIGSELVCKRYRAH